LSASWCATAVHLTFLADQPDTHIERKFGKGAAETVRRQAERLVSEVELGPAAAAVLIDFDVALKQQGLNPGTCADLTVATLFLDALLGSSGIKS
jgi:triphosphoribosyl-dephospho-CoA synthase